MNRFSCIQHAMSTLLLDLTLSGQRGDAIIRVAYSEGLFHAAALLDFVILANVDECVWRRIGADSRHGRGRRDGAQECFVYQGGAQSRTCGSSLWLFAPAGVPSSGLQNGILYCACFALVFGACSSASVPSSKAAVWHIVLCLFCLGL